MYTGFLISDSSREKLMKIFPPLYPTVLGHHITYAFGGKAGSIPEQPSTVVVVGVITGNDKIQGLLVEVDGSIERPDGKDYHITWSIDEEKGAKPFETNKWTKSAFILPFDKRIKIDVIPKLFTKSTKEEMKRA